MDVEIFREKAENQVDGELGTEIHDDQRTEQSVRNSVRFTECDEKKRRQREYRSHRNICKITGIACAFKIIHISFSNRIFLDYTMI